MPRRQTLILAVAFCLAILAAFFFGLRAGRTVRHIHREDEPIRAWMSVPFVAHTRHVPEDVLFRAVGVTPNRHDHRPLRDIARDQHRPVRDLIADLDAAVAAGESRAP